MHLIKLACGLPDRCGRSPSPWACAELARTLERDGIVEDLSPQSVQRLLQAQKRKPWRVHDWLGQETLRDEACRQQTLNVMDLSTQEPGAQERVLSMDEKTSIQPRPRTAETRPAQAAGAPVRLEHQYERKGAPNLLAALDPRSGEGIGIGRRRKRQVEVIELLEEIERRLPVSVTIIHIVCDNVRPYRGKQVRAWLQRYPRSRHPFTPVHCSWMNQIEQWFSIIQGKRLCAPRIANLEVKLLAFIDEWNEAPHPFAWIRQSLARALRGTPEGLCLAA